MSINDKVDEVLVYGQYMATSQTEANEIITKATEMEYDFVSDTMSNGIAVWSLTVI